jgi:hypothetical protein
MTLTKKSASEINQSCACKTLNHDELSRRLEKTGVLKGIYQEIIKTRPHLFSSTMVFISKENAAKMINLISTIERIVEDPRFEQHTLPDSPPVTHFNPITRGVFMGYDFHLSENGPKLIEINTNAGGVLLNAELAEAQSSCCVEVSVDQNLEEKIFSSFLNEWRLQSGEKKLTTVAIVDESPKEQFLYPEFLLFQRLFQERGIICDILSPEEIKKNDKLLIGPHGPIDLIYNRLTDFYLEAPHLKHLREAYLTGDIVLTPNPRHHALLANKKNLSFLRDPDLLERLHIQEKERNLLIEAIPESREVSAENHDYLWERRKNYFFKPVSGFGSRGSYRGDKMTRRVWEEISKEKYIAQQVIPPGLKLVDVNGKQVNLKVDIRAYTYDAQVILFAARLYSGQTTNFRTEGGGFAPVFTVP